MSVKLIIDDREKKNNIKELISAEFAAGKVYKSAGDICHEIRRWDIGDYAIIKDELLVAVIERKSLADYGASIKDGRNRNKANLINARNENGCKIYYLIEGPLNPKLDTKYAGIEYSKILASIHRLQIRDSIHIVRTQNAAHTARELKIMCEIYTSTDAIIGGERETKTKSVEQVVNAAKQTPEERFNSDLIGLWKVVPGVGETAAAMLASNYTLRQWIKSEIDIATLRVNGRANARLAKLLADPPEPEIELLLLSKMRGITKSSAEDMLLSVRLEYYLHPNLAKSAIIGSKKLGQKKADLVYKYLTSTLANS